MYGEDEMLIAGYKMYELLQAQERACAKSCLGVSWKGSSVSIDLSQAGISSKPGLPLVAGDQTGTEVVANEGFSFPFIITERQFRCIWPDFASEHFFMD